MIGSNGKRIRN